MRMISAESDLCTRRVLRGLLPLLMALACLVVAWTVFGVRYEVNDDATLSNIAAGAYGPETERLVYINILLGWAIKPLYALAGGVNWLVMLQVAADVAAFSVLCGLLMEKCGTARGAVISALLLLLGGIELFHSIQYAKNSGLYLAVGLALIADNLGKWNARTGWGIFWTVLGSMVRFQNFPAVGGMCAALLLWRFFALDGAAKKRAVLTMVVLFALVFGAKGVDVAAYRLDDGWAAFTRYNAARTEVSDFRLQYITSADQLASYGYSPNDYDTLVHWSYYDPDVLPVERLEELAEVLPTKGIVQSIKDAVYTGIHMFSGEAFRLLLAGVALAWLFFSGPRGRLAFLGTMALMGVMVLYLSWRGRFPHRVEYTLVLAAAVFGALCCTPGLCTPASLRQLCFAAAAVVVFTMPYFETMRQSMEGYRMYRVDVPDYIEFSADKDNLYLVDVDVTDSLEGYDVFHPRPAGFFSNMVAMGGWLSGAPHRIAAMEAYGVRNPYRDMVDNDSVYLLDFYNAAAKETYLLEHYGLSVERERVREVGGFNLYRVRTQVSQ